ncbi:YbjQ family protein [Legionella yabuuchiae]|uniref:YbjQ family protein n=1 Tax=Legionella yabuuchiae TaxID=376727 RepID=UPI001054EB57|nr:YbjQ family protein [Legionella yabuuchiae]
MSIPVTTSNSFEGKPIKQYLGIVRGIVVRSPTITQGLMGGLKSIVGGKIGSYTEMCEHAREEAFELMLKHAEELGANAVISMRYDAGELGQIGTEVLCYGTAVII